MWEPWPSTLLSHFLDFEDTESILPLDVFETNENIIIDVEIPGVKKDDVELKLKENILTIAVEKKRGTPEKSKSLWIGRSVGKVTRKLQLPKYINTNGIETLYEYGILRIVIPKSPQGKEIVIPLK